MAAMADIPDDYRDLLGAQFATLGTVEPDGTPQLSEIWFLHDDGEIRRRSTPPGARPGTSCSARSAA
jgi:predicted pyridoxine 5'-phosphate oxidase superfamily flavin-nucleotide-binding protein